MTLYVVSKEKDANVYYVHQYGYPWIPVLGTFTKSKKQALKTAMDYSCCNTTEEYQTLKRRKAAKK